MPVVGGVVGDHALVEGRVASLVDAMRWCNVALERAAAAIGFPSLMDSLCERRFTTSTAFSGIGTPEIADEVIGKSVKKVIESHGLSRLGPSFAPRFAIEINRTAIEA